MKKTIAHLTLFLFIGIGLASCKKNDTPLTTQQKVLGRWSLLNIITNDHYAGADHSFTSAGSTSDYFDFRSDGKLYFSFAGTIDTVAYSLSGDTKILIDGTELYDIKTLTSDSFVIYKKEYFGADYEEETINWKK
jgi:hypothetical protein